jgi:hypothetical protein
MPRNKQEISPVCRVSPSLLDLSFESALEHGQPKEIGDKMSQLFVYILADVLKDMVKHLSAGDKLSAFSCSKKARGLIIQNGYSSNSGIICEKYKEFSKMHMKMLFGELVTFICSEPPFHDGSKCSQRLCLQLLIEIFRSEDIFANESSPLVLSEICKKFFYLYFVNLVYLVLIAIRCRIGEVPSKARLLWRRCGICWTKFTHQSQFIFVIKRIWPIFQPSWECQEAN